jgi:ASC-1-like (ASCH) protein|tara:strand:- start:684 stop:1040 length:357 start_codon:yes stop_codon:yes gene_type:complete
MNRKSVKSRVRVHIRRSESYSLILSGIKSAEVRLLKGIICGIKVGDMVYMIHHDKKICIEILEIKVFSSLKEMLENILIRNMALPGIEDSKCERYYEQFYGKEQIERNKVVALVFKIH